MKDIPLWLKYVSALAAVVGIIWGVYIYLVPDASGLLGSGQAATVLGAETIANGINIADILNRYNAKETSLAKQGFLATYENSKVYGIGSFADIAKMGNEYIVTLKVSENLVSCSFNIDPETERRLLILSKGQTVVFTGDFSGSVVWGGGWTIRDCAFGK